MTRRPLVLAAALLCAPLSIPLAAQVGHTPENSPFEDLRGRQGLTLATGVIAPGDDPAGVAPGAGMQLNARYELLLAGPLWLQVRAMYAPSLTRQVKDPLLTGDARNLNLSRRPHAGLEAGFLLNLTGQKAWRRIAPQFHGGLGWMTGGTARFDQGGYRFGNKFTVSYGVGARIVTGREWEVHTDLTHLFWRYKYPEDFGRSGAAGQDAILPNSQLQPWKGNMVLSVGMTRFFFR